jgi:hypothetical protein
MGILGVGGFTVKLHIPEYETKGAQDTGDLN